MSEWLFVQLIKIIKMKRRTIVLSQLVVDQLHTSAIRMNVNDTSVMKRSGKNTMWRNKKKSGKVNMKWNFISSAPAHWIPTANLLLRMSMWNMQNGRLHAFYYECKESSSLQAKQKSTITERKNYYMPNISDDNVRFERASAWDSPQKWWLRMSVLQCVIIQSCSFFLFAFLTLGEQFGYKTNEKKQLYSLRA